MLMRSMGLCALVVTALVPCVRGQGLIVGRHGGASVPVPIAGSFEVKRVGIEATVKDQVAEVRVDQVFHNPGSAVIESEYLFPVPDDGAVSNVVLLVDGKEFGGKLMGKDEARRIYEEIVRSRRDPALLEYVGRGLIKTSVFPIPPGADRTVTLKYTQLLKRDSNSVSFSYPFGTQKFSAKPIEVLEARVRIESRDAIKSIFSPSHSVGIQRPGDRDAVVTLKLDRVVPTADFRLIYTLAEGAVGTSVLSYRPVAGEDGYFLMLMSPQVKKVEQETQPKTIVFVLDRSGSMTGPKIEQAREALKFVLRNLNDDDLFNIVVYDDTAELYRPELERCTSASREAAVRWVDNIRPGGSTNIDEALQKAIGQVQDEARPSYVLFLTDGLPTAGETNELKLAEKVKAANAHHARVFSFGVGFDVNARLLDRISGAHGGTSAYVKPDENIEATVASFARKLTSPVLSRIAVAMEGVDLNRIYPRELPDLFEGGQLVVVGRYTKSGKAVVRVSGKAGSESLELATPVELAEASTAGPNGFVERLWATRRIGAILDDIDLKGQNPELVQELTALSTKYGILTPYTAFLADDRVDTLAVRQNEAKVLESLSDLSVVGGAAGVGQRMAKRFYQDSEQDSLSALPGVVTAPAAGRVTGGGGRDKAMADAAAPARPAIAAGTPVLAKDTAGQDVVVETVRQLGSRTFYRKSERWIEAGITAEEEQKATKVEQFSDAFFSLAAGLPEGEAQYLTFREPVVVRLKGQVYRVDPQARP